MSTEITNNIDVSLDTTDVTQDNTKGIVNTNQHEVSLQQAEATVEGHKKEYSIVGDRLYASVTATETPQWLAALIDNVVTNAIASGMTDYDLLVQDVRNAIDSIDVAKNTYVEQINVDAIVNGIVATHLDTLNATYEANFATKSELSTAIATTESAIAQNISDLSVSFADDLTSRVTNIQTAYAAANKVLAGNIDALSVAFIDQEANLSATANAVSGLQTYVGIDDTSSPNGTGMLARIGIIEKQVDSKIEYWFVDSTNDPKNSWTTAAQRANRDGDVWYQTDTKQTFYYTSSNNSWNAVTDKDALQAIADAAAAQSTADGKISSYFAIESSATPGAPGSTHATIDSTAYKVPNYWYNSSNKTLYEYENSAWTTMDSVPLSDGDELKTVRFAESNTLVDYFWYEYVTDTWLLRTPDGLVAKSSWAVNLDAYLGGDGAGNYGAESGLTSLINTTSNGKVETAFEYSTTTKAIGGTYHNAGFGLKTIAGTGTSEDPYSSEFWVSADTFKISNGTTASPVFTVDATTGAVSINGNVSIGSTAVNNLPKAYGSLSSAPTGTITIGSTYYNTSTGITYNYNGTSWTTTKGDTGPQGPQGIQGIAGTNAARNLITRDYYSWNFQENMTLLSHNDAISELTIKPTTTHFTYNYIRYSGPWIKAVTNATDGYFYLGRSETDYNISFPAGRKLVVSWVAYRDTYGTESKNQVYLKLPNGSHLARTPVGGPYVGFKAPKRFHAVFDLTGTYYTSALLRFDVNTANTRMYFKEFQVEIDNGSGLPTDYSPSLEGDKGLSGAGFYTLTLHDGVFPPSLEARNDFYLAYGRDPVVDDHLTYRNKKGTISSTKRFDGAKWVAPTMLIHGDLLATGTVTGDRLVAGTEIKAPVIKSGAGGPYDGYNTLISADGTIQTNRLEVPNGYISHLQLATGAATSQHYATASTNTVTLHIPTVPGSQAFIAFMTFCWLGYNAVPPSTYLASLIVYDRGVEIYRRNHQFSRYHTYHVTMVTPAATHSNGLTAVITTNLSATPAYGVELSISAMNSIR